VEREQSIRFLRGPQLQIEDSSEKTVPKTRTSQN